jgi:hypothetical protein
VGKLPVIVTLAPIRSAFAAETQRDIIPASEMDANLLTLSRSEMWLTLSPFRSRGAEIRWFAR